MKLGKKILFPVLTSVENQQRNFFEEHSLLWPAPLTEIRWPLVKWTFSLYVCYKYLKWKIWIMSNMVVEHNTKSPVAVQTHRRKEGNWGGNGTIRRFNWLDLAWANQWNWCCWRSDRICLTACTFCAPASGPKLWANEGMDGLLCLKCNQGMRTSPLA